MLRVSLFSFVLGAALFVFGAGWAAETVHWGYAGEEGPENWAKLSPEFAACAGKNQAPIDLTRFVKANLKPLKISYRAGGQEIVNNGHTVQVNYGPGSSISIDGIQFTLTQFHFHAPSENHINGKSYPMEGHFVHADKDGNLAVVALMFNDGTENKALKSLWSLMPETAGDKAQLPSSFDAASLLPPSYAYYRFNGSLTTPPCTEGVRWLVLKTPVSVSREQLTAFVHVMHHPNNRPLQPLNARTVLE